MLTAASVMISEAVADPPGGANAGFARHHGAHQLVRVQAALHQGLCLPLPDELDGLGPGIMAVRGFLEREP